MKSLADPLNEWFERNGRDYPWRKETNPYKVLIAEIMLQRTRADQVKQVYVSFMQEFPTPQILNKAPLKAIEDYFSRLGLKWRAGLIKSLASELINKFQGEVPDDRESLLSLHSVGGYVADAVLVFAYGRSVAVVDSNVCRILGRVFGLEVRGEARRDPRFKDLARSILPHERVKDFNWAMIDLAALICTPRNPKCSQCPINRRCAYYSTQYRPEKPR